MLSKVAFKTYWRPEVWEENTCAYLIISEAFFFLCWAALAAPGRLSLDLGDSLSLLVSVTPAYWLMWLK